LKPTEAQPDPLGLETLENFSEVPRFNQWLYAKIARFASGQILEIGSGIGNISAFLLKDQPDTTLSDLRPEYCQILENKFGQNPNLRGIYSLDLSLTDFNSRYSVLLEKFDTVIALNVVEHIEEDSIAIRNAKALLRKNGKLIILVPAGQWLYNSLDHELGHFKRYSKAGLKKLMESAGFSVSYCRYFNAAAILGWFISGNILGEKLIPQSKLHVFNKLLPVFRILDWFITPFAGISVISTGIKK
jgi:SAM-dependent methyltransferase